MSKTIYVYDPSTGKISYTIENAKTENAISLKNRGINFFADTINHKIIGTYVVKHEVTGQPIGIENIKEMTSVIINKTQVVADGNDTVIIAPLLEGTTVNISKENFSFVSDLENNSVEITADGYSLDETENVIYVSLSKYGYKNKGFMINIIPDVV